MATIYISSTYNDLIKEREAADKAVRRLGHNTIAMENYVASDQRPVDKCLADVRRCDAYIGIFAWRYGFVPRGYDKSITHLEYEAARKTGIPCLIFLLDKNAAWPAPMIAAGEERAKINGLRRELEQAHTVSPFTNTDDLVSLVSPAVSNLNNLETPKTINQMIGSRLGRYVIREKIGRGSRGIVYKVMDTFLEKPKAIKIIPSEITDSLVYLKELKQEVNNASEIIHPNVVKVLGLEKHEGQYFIVMEYISGRSLGQIMADPGSGKLSEPVVLNIVEKLAQGLHETHKKNIIHRDIKPANIMLTDDNDVKILDFGISYQITKAMTDLVGEDQRSGTWPYMAPEQLSTDFGRDNQQVDVWGLGVTMYQLLTRKLPFTYKEQIKDKYEKPFPMEGVSHKSREVVMKCLEKDMNKRFQSMAEVLEVLRKPSKPEPGKVLPQLNKVIEKKVGAPSAIDNKIKSFSAISKPVKKEKHGKKLIVRAVSMVVFILMVIYIVIIVDSIIKKDPFIANGSKTYNGSMETQDSMTFEKASKRDNIYAYKDYIRNFPDGKHVTEVNDKIENIEDNNAFKKASNEDTLISYNHYVTQFPYGKHMAEVEEKIDKIEDTNAFKKASNEYTLISYNRYITQFPTGKHVSKAKKKIEEIIKDDLFFDNSSKKDSISAYRDYLNTFPSGRHAEEAKEKIKILKKTPEEL